MLVLLLNRKLVCRSLSVRVQRENLIVKNSILVVPGKSFLGNFLVGFSRMFTV